LSRNSAITRSSFRKYAQTPNNRRTVIAKTAVKANAIRCNLRLPFIPIVCALPCRASYAKPRIVRPFVTIYISNPKPENSAIFPVLVFRFSCGPVCVPFCAPLCGFCGQHFLNTEFTETRHRKELQHPFIAYFQFLSRALTPSITVSTAFT
jgi:hypothetical protein